MGKIGDWIEIFENLEYFLYGASMSMNEISGVSFERITEEKEREGVVKKPGKQSFGSGVNGKIFPVEKLKEWEMNTQRIEEKVYLTEKSLKFYNKLFREGERGLGLKKWGKYEKPGKVTPLGKTAVEVFNKKDGYVFGGYGEMGKEKIFENRFTGKVTEREKKKIFESAIRQDRGENENIKLEVHHVAKDVSELDMDKVTDMLTDRLYEMMQKSTEGFYI